MTTNKFRYISSRLARCTAGFVSTNRTLDPKKGRKTSIG